MLFDDRKISLGKKIKDSELIGIPWTIIVGKKFNETNKIELINRSNNTVENLSISDLEKFDYEKNIS